MTATFRPLPNKDPAVEVERRDDGTIILRNPHPMDDPHVNVIAPLRQWAEEVPGRSWLVERGEDGEWVHLTYKDANDKVNRVAQAQASPGDGQGWAPGVRPRRVGAALRRRGAAGRRSPASRSWRSPLVYLSMIRRTLLVRLQREA